MTAEERRPRSRRRSGAVVASVTAGPAHARRMRRRQRQPLATVVTSEMA